ncbi:hypothetical protein OIO90_002399 [Microbotryomycetes sp. JL221]|nr:hypothetical protein OIO90_002399 [Microbotryomycetes sp. JL221]
MARRKRNHNRATSTAVASNEFSSSTNPNVPGPASTPQISHQPPPLQPEHLFPLLKQTPSRTSLSTATQHHHHHAYSTATTTQHRRASLQTLRASSNPSPKLEPLSLASLPSYPISTNVQHDQYDDQQNIEMYRWGVTLVAVSMACFILGFWSIAVGPFLSPQGNWLLDKMSKDTHYKYLFILLVPVTLYAVIINWWGLKIFRHA